MATRPQKRSVRTTQSRPSMPPVTSNPPEALHPLKFKIHKSKNPRAKFPMAVASPCIFHNTIACSWFDFFRVSRRILCYMQGMIP